jgi:hypothetical protein
MNFELLIEDLVKMPPAARGSFEKPPLDPTKLLFRSFLLFLPEAQLLIN